MGYSDGNIFFPAIKPINNLIVFYHVLMITFWPLDLINMASGINPNTIAVLGVESGTIHH